MPKEQMTSFKELTFSEKVGYIFGYYKYHMLAFVITALVNVGEHSYSKEYKITIAGEESVVKETVLDEAFTSAADMDNWTFASLADGARKGGLEF